MTTLPILFTLSYPVLNSHPTTNCGGRFWTQTQFISAELMDDQLLLLLESLERKIVSQQLRLVENLLNHDLDKGKETFHFDAELLSFPHEEEQRLTTELVELSGVQLQEDGSALLRDQPFEPMAALFVALYALNLLSGSE
ncbi:gasdermin-A3-like [Cyanistes caeruleus]|uniref:gasdermin-A3-like n=1 Tax=Cyanistes caeruleus TaxID=156563 RepID=UPI000CDB37CF|nr:gasdermin-A3-like [Cyanistes caeruleus]